MKQIKTLIVVALIIFSGACSKILDENPRAIYTPGYFKTQAGVMGGLNYMYLHLRLITTSGYNYVGFQSGTDEGTWGQNVNGDAKLYDMVPAKTGYFTNNGCSLGGLWIPVYGNINTASGIIENDVNPADTALVAEARFFRAWDYFLMVQIWGGVPLDQGAGELKFNTSPSRTSKRNTVPEVYTRGIFPDLRIAAKSLPATSRMTGTATRTLAQLYLSKAYLTYGWWLQNPNNISTYPQCDRTDPDGHNATWYFQQAYDVANAAISNVPSSIGLNATYYDLTRATNDRNKECLLYADHTQANAIYNGGTITGVTGGGGQDEFSPWFTTWNYTNIKSSSSSTTWTAQSSVQREAEQHLGRPWTGVCPPIEVFTNTFADKVNDSRYDGTFTTVYRGNWAKNTTIAGIKTLYNANNLPRVSGDSLLTFLDSDPGNITYPANGSLGQNNVAAGWIPGRADWVIAPMGISRLAYPGLYKLGPYRTDNNGGLGEASAGYTRPFVYAKFSELFLLAAEAAVKGATTKAVTGAYANDGTAVGLVNVLRARAGKWTFSNNGNAAKVVDHSADMTALTPAGIDINYILAERSREFFGEGIRWLDLVRTQKWAELAGTYTICDNSGSSSGDHIPVVVARTIVDKDWLRPISQTTIDAFTAMSAADRAAYQNPGY